MGKDGLRQAWPCICERLSKFEVVAPEKAQQVNRDIAFSPIERPGVYVLQAGSYRKSRTRYACARSSRRRAS